MSISHPIRRFSNPHSRQEELINAYEAEEERIINVLSRKLEQVCSSVTFHDMDLLANDSCLCVCVRTLVEGRKNCAGEYSGGGIGIAR